MCIFFSSKDHMKLLKKNIYLPTYINSFQDVTLNKVSFTL